MPKKQTIKKSALTPTVLIAGGAGFIGSHLVEKLLDKGSRVLVLDNFNTGKEVHVNHLLDNPNFALYNVDINEALPEEIESVDYIFHFAGLEEYLFNKDVLTLDSLMTNAMGTKNLLDLAKKSDAKFLLASSIDVYQGRLSQLDLKNYFGYTSFEEGKYSLTEAKRYAEALVWEYYKKYDTNVRIVRLPEVYGPRMSLDASGSLGGFMKALIEGRGLTVYGDGAEKEAYLYVSDAVSGIVKALFEEGTKGNIYSLIKDDPSTVLELAYVVKKVADREVEVKFEPGPTQIMPGISHPDTHNLKDLSWSPKIDLKSGIGKTLTWFGYSVNEHSFKPSKLIEDKYGTKVSEPAQTEPPELTPKSSISDDSLVSLQGLKDEGHMKLVQRSKPGESAPAASPPLPKEIVTPTPIAAKAWYKEKPKSSKPKLGGVFTTLKEKFPRKKQGLEVSPVRPVLVYNVLAVLTAAFLVFLLLPGASLYYNGRKSLTHLENAVLAANTADSAKLKEEAIKSHERLSNTRSSLNRLGWVFKIVGKKDLYVSLDKLLGSLTFTTSAGAHIAEAAKPFEELWLVIKPNTTQELDVDSFNAAKLSLSSAKGEIKLAEADFKYVNRDVLPSSISGKVVMYATVLSTASESLDLATSLIEGLPGIIGSDGSKKYMVLFQNSNEIRPTGGFIGSYAVLSMDKGKVKSLEIDDIYNPDGQIALRNINVDQPAALEEFLGEDRLYLRNANWNPDFGESAKTIEDLYYKVTGEDVDGVIALDLYFVESLLDVVGPVFLTAYNEEINSDNLYEKTQFYSEFNYENGSDQKRSFLTVLGSKLLEKLFSLPQDSLPALLGSMATSLDHRHMSIYLDNSPTMAVLAQHGWDGGLHKTEHDYLQIVNANVGGTKANYYIENSYQYDVLTQTRDGLLRAQLKLNYKHTGEDGAWPGGPYTNYLRVITQSGIKLTGAKITVNDSEEQDILETVVVTSLDGYDFIETSFVLDPSKTAEIVFSYDLPTDMTLTGENMDYQLYWQKQAGTQNDKYRFSLHPPFGLSAGVTNPRLNISSDEVYSEGTIDNDLEFYIALH